MISPLEILSLFAAFDFALMARLSSRQARTQRLIRLYLRYHTAQIKRRIRVKNKTMRVLRRAGYTEQEQQLACLPVPVQAPIPPIQLRYTGDSDSDSLTSSLDSDSDSTETTSSSSDDGWSDLLGSDWRGSGGSESSEDSGVSSESDGGDADDEMPELLPLGYPDSDDEDNEESLSSDEGGHPIRRLYATWRGCYTKTTTLARHAATRHCAGYSNLWKRCTHSGTKCPEMPSHAGPLSCPTSSPS